MTASYRRILLTGGTGFVGSYLAPAIVEAWPDAERLLLRRPGEFVERAGWATADVEITDASELAAIVKKFRPDLVLHLAAYSSIEHDPAAAQATWRINLGGTLALAGACARYCKNLTFFFVSSSEVYGASFKEGIATEETLLRPMNAYAHAKAAAESALRDFLRRGKIIIARPFNHTGPGQDLRFVMPTIAAQVVDIEAGRRPPKLELGDVSAQRDFLDVRDVCAAYLAMLRAPQSRHLNVFNVASGATYRIGDLVEKFRSRTTKPFDIDIDPNRLRPSSIPVAAGSSAKLARATGWRPKITIDETIDALLDHWRKMLPIAVADQAAAKPKNAGL